MDMGERERLLRLSSGYKEQIYEKLVELFPKRLEGADLAEWQDKSTEELLRLAYVKGVAEALDGFDVEELLAALDGGEGLEA